MGTPNKVKRFHQVVRCVKGAGNTAIINLANGHIYHLENWVIDQFNNQDFHNIEEILQSLENENLIIEVDENTWIPQVDLERKDFEHLGFILEIEAGVDLELVHQVFKGFKIARLFFYGLSELNLPQEIFPGVEVVYVEKDFNLCIQRSTPGKKQEKVNENIYHINKNLNSCWGHKIAITKDHQLRPCIFSSIIIGNLMDRDISVYMTKIKEYWYISKDRVERCQDCEFRYTCFDCRELAYRTSGNLFAPNPNCSYNPYP